MEGFDVMPALAAARARRRVHHRYRARATCCTREHFERMKDGAVLANAGHFDVEICLPDLRAAARRCRRVRPLVDRYVIGGRR